jgi:hypothetical protein
MYTPMRIAAALGAALRGATVEGATVEGAIAEGTAAGGEVMYQSTTRSPAHPVDVPEYAIRTALTFPAPEDPSRASHVYNVRPGCYDEIVVVVDSGGAGPAGLTQALRRCAPVTIVTIPSYVPAVAR